MREQTPDACTPYPPPPPPPQRITCIAFRYKVDIESLEPSLLSEHPSAPIVALAFDPASADIVHCVDATGVFRTFSLSDYRVLCKGLSAGAAA